MSETRNADSVPFWLSYGKGEGGIEIENNLTQGRRFALGRYRPKQRLIKVGAQRFPVGNGK